MPVFDITFLLSSHDSTEVDALFRTVDWPWLPREGESVEIAEGLCALTVESVGYGVDGPANVFLGRVVLDDLQVVQLRKAGWRMERLLISESP
jgi:hypothetical protein